MARIELRIFLPNRHVSQFWAQKRESPPRKADTLNAIVCQTAPLAKLPLGGFLCNHEIRRFQTKCRFCFKEWSVSSTHTFYYVNNYKSENLPRCYNNGKLESGSFILLTPLR